MKILRFILLTALLIWTIACADESQNNLNANLNSAGQDNSVQSKIPTKDNLEELAAIVRLPEMPEEVVWREEENSNGKKLIAVLKYDAEKSGKIVASAEKLKPVETAEIGTESWFPEELTALSQLSGSETVKVNIYGANDFYNQPYTNGKLSRFNETNFFLLELTDR